MRAVLTFFVLVLAFFYVGALFMSENMEVEEHTFIDVPKDSLFNYLNCMKNWEEWSPFQANIVESKYTNIECGQGSRLNWTDKNTSGSQEIVISSPTDSIVYQWVFNQGDKAISKMFFQSQKEGTDLVWTLKTEMSYPWGRWIGRFLLQPSTETTFQKGLYRLDSVSSGRFNE